MGIYSTDDFRAGIAEMTGMRLIEGMAETSGMGLKAGTAEITGAGAGVAWAAGTGAGCVLTGFCMSQSTFSGQSQKLLTEFHSSGAVQVNLKDRPLAQIK